LRVYVKKLLGIATEEEWAEEKLIGSILYTYMEIYKSGQMGGVLMEQQMKTSKVGRGRGSTNPKGIRSLLGVFFNAHRNSRVEVPKGMLDILLKTTNLLDDPVLKDNKNVIIIVARDIKSLGEYVCTGEVGKAVLERLDAIADEKNNYPKEARDAAASAVQKIDGRWK